MEKMYSYDELAHILGCSRTAVSKKVKPVENEPGVERYKQRYNVVLNNGVKCILLDDEALETEKMLSKGTKKVSNKGVNTPEKAIESGIQDNLDDERLNVELNVTERYIDKFVTFQQYMYNQLQERDKQILLLSVDEKQKETVYFQTTAENKKLTEQYNVLKHKYDIAQNVIKCFIGLLLICITSFITFKTVSHNVVQPAEKPEQIVQPEQDTKKATAEPVKAPTVAAAKKNGYKRK